MDPVAHDSQMQRRVTVGVRGIDVYQWQPINTFTPSQHAAAGGYTISEPAYRQEPSHGVEATVDNSYVERRATAHVEDVNSGRDAGVSVDGVGSRGALLPAMSVSHAGDDEEMVDDADVATDTRQMQRIVAIVRRQFRTLWIHLHIVTRTRGNYG